MTVHELSRVLAFLFGSQVSPYARTLDAYKLKLSDLLFSLTVLHVR